MKLMNLAQPFRRRFPQAVVLGSLAFGVQVACSDAPVNGGNNTTFPMAGTPSTAGTPAATAGTPATTAGTFGASGSFGTAGTPAGGTETGGTGGTGTAGTATAGTGGTAVVVPTTPYCMGKPLDPLPYTANDGFELSGWNAGAQTQATANANIVNRPADACLTRVPGAVGRCSQWHFIPAVASGFAFVQWITMWDSQFTHPPVCIAEGAKAVTFAAKGLKGGETFTVAAGLGMQDKEVVLSTEWEHYFIPLDGVEYNSFNSGVVEGFTWKIVPTETTPVMDFFIDDIKWVKDLPVDGGEGGAGGAGGAGN